ncbi:aminopeptidase [Phorcysia thermohydrogeniphila]|uniref:Leucyl aminopeptidase (Aminopeptidase T) n=1 Tax=Phorcysia thermohydrogeniphila TaxID=936138 RepID=A0A4R1GHR0_9BACT|nr:aminopeptidase [Phorcysia thermohydrogeniphila]TCK06621.1 leucyl aminopeptidase (aminopeptidase T) [Phorcysia thermohydrogeniphila]
MGIWDWQDERIKKAIRNLFKHNLCVTKEDKVLILSDSYKERIGELFFFVGTSHTSSITHLSYSPTGRHGFEPPEEVWRATFGSEFVEELKQKNLLEKVLKKEITESEEEEVKEILLETTEPPNLPTVIVAVNRFSISHTLYRKLCTGFLSMRFASMPLFEPFMFYTSMQANWNKVAERSKLLSNLLTEAREVHVTCPLGTDIRFSVEGREGLADTGKLCTPSSFGNLPAGEAFIAPVEGSAEGIFVTKFAPDRELKEPVRLTVKEGKVEEISGEVEFSEFLRGIFRLEENANNVAEFGIGTNEKAKHYTNILEAEKILGTCHIAVGDNSAFGGKVKANVHIDLLIDKPTIKLKLKDREITLMEEGKLTVLTESE